MKKLIFPMFIESSKGGMQSIVIDLIVSLSQRGWNCILIGYTDCDLVKLCENRGIRTMGIDMPSSNIGYIPFIFNLYNLIRHLGDSVIIVNDIFTHIILSLYPGKKREFFVSHGGDYKSKGKEYAAKSGFAAKIAKYTFKRVTSFVAVSDTQKQALIENAKVPAHKVFAINNGVKVSESAPAIHSHQFHLCLQISIIGYVKRLKNQFVLLDVIDKLLNKGVRCKLNIFGSVDDESYYSEIKDRISELNIGDSVEFFGYVSDKEFIYNNSDIVVSCSFHEGFGLSLVEAMAYYKPTIAYRKAAGPASIIINDQTGILVENNTSEDYLNAILKYYQNPDYKDRIIHNAYDDYVKKFSFDSMVEKYESIIENA